MKGIVQVCILARTWRVNQMYLSLNLRQYRQNEI